MYLAEVFDPDLIKLVGEVLLVLLLPGLLWSFALYRRGELCILERLTLSLALSFCLLTLLMAVLYALGFNLTYPILLVTLLVSSTPPVLILVLRRWGGGGGKRKSRSRGCA